MSDANRLDSWKDIAVYLHRDVRTCQRWHTDFGLPVHRYVQSSRSRVFALKSEIDSWLASEKGGEPDEKGAGGELRERSGKRRTLFVAAAAALVMAVFLMGMRFMAGPKIVGFKVQGTKLQFLDAKNEVRAEWESGNPRLGAWDYRLAEAKDGNESPRESQGSLRCVWRADLRAFAGKQFILIGPSLEAADKTSLKCLSMRGKLRWSFDPRGIMLGARSCDLDGDGRVETVVVSFPRDESWAEIDVLDEKGREKAQFVNPGIIKDFILADVDDDPMVEILAVGYCGPERRPALAVIDYGRMMEKDGTTGEGWRSEISLAEHYILMPKSEVETAVLGNDQLMEILIPEGTSRGTLEVRNWAHYRLHLKEGLKSVMPSARLGLEFEGEGDAGERLSRYLEKLRRSGIRFLIGGHQT